jgi:hypothetical protein
VSSSKRVAHNFGIHPVLIVERGAELEYWNEVELIGNCRHFHLSQGQWRHDPELRIALSHAFNTPSQCVFCVVEHLQALRSFGSPVRDSRAVSKRYRITDFTTPVRWCSEHSKEIISFNVSCLYTWNCLLLSSLSRAAPAEQ